VLAALDEGSWPALGARGVVMILLHHHLLRLPLLEPPSPYHDNETLSTPIRKLCREHGKACEVGRPTTKGR